jgi:hypothetical protein
MTPAQYGLFWGLFPRVSGMPGMPPYANYLSRENFLEDYLDIFRGRDTRATRGLLGPHPFHAQLSNTHFVAPKIAYVLIGEAAHSSSDTFFYNPAHLKSTNWLRSPLEAFGCGASYPKTLKEKIAALYTLAMKGFLLLDLYPFALDYSSKMRAAIDYIPFWEQLVDRINGLSAHGLIQADCLLAFSGPAKTHHQIAVQLHNQHLHGAPQLISLPHQGMLTWGENILTNGLGASVPPTRVQPLLFNWSLPGTGVDLDGRFPVDATNFYAPKYKCETWDGSFVNGPASKFIKVAFRLP